MVWPAARKQRVRPEGPQRDYQEVSREMEGIARDVAPPCGQGAGALGLWVVCAACPPLQASARYDAGGL